MSEELAEEQSTTTQIDAVKKPPAIHNPTVVLAAVVLAGILSFALLMWAQGIRMEAAKRDSFGKGVDGLSATLAIPILEAVSPTKENRVARLQAIAQSIQNAGRYEQVVISDGNGVVLATTDTGLVNQTIKEMAEAKRPATIRPVDQSVEATVSIENEGGSKLGALRIRTKL
ncbi:MAG: hypothetical protein JSS66_00500 [Armatimonadetes bacterium]|nr:hypothetical protein [Armatimonadota bacterium]